MLVFWTGNFLIFKIFEEKFVWLVEHSVRMMSFGKTKCQMENYTCTAVIWTVYIHVRGCYVSFDFLDKKWCQLILFDFQTWCKSNSVKFEHMPSDWHVRYTDNNFCNSFWVNPNFGLCSVKEIRFDFVYIVLF